MIFKQSMIFAECHSIPKPLSSPSQQLKQKISLVPLGEVANTTSFLEPATSPEPGATSSNNYAMRFSERARPDYDLSSDSS